jgi:hypothetical protein
MFSSLASFHCYLCITHICLSVQNPSERENSNKMGKKSKKTAGASTTSAAGQALVDKKKGLISDTTCTGLTRVTWQVTYNLIEAEEPEKTVTEATADPTRKSECSSRI